MPTIAVLTGDLVDSTRVDNPSAFLAQLHAVLRQVEERFYGKTATYRGDGFQATLSDPLQAMRCALYIRAGLIAASPRRDDRWDARISVAIGVDNDEDAAFGDAHIASGRGLDALGKEHLCLYARPSIFQLATGIATAFADDIIRQWSPSEAEAYHTYLQYPESHQAVADVLGKSRATITKSLIRARYSLIERYLDSVNQLLEQTRVI